MDDMDDMTGMTDRDADREVTTWWHRPCEWRQPRGHVEPFWVEEEVLVLVGPQLVEQLSWSASLSSEERTGYDEALSLKAALVR